MPRTVKRRRKRPLIEVGVSVVPILISHGARVVALNEFLSGQHQNYLTLLAGPHVHFITYHARPLPFIVQLSGKIIPDESYPTLEYRQITRYHPS